MPVRTVLQCSVEDWFERGGAVAAVRRNCRSPVDRMRQRISIQDQELNQEICSRRTPVSALSFRNAMLGISYSMRRTGGSAGLPPIEKEWASTSWARFACALRATLQRRSNRVQTSSCGVGPHRFITLRSHCSHARRLGGSITHIITHTYIIYLTSFVVAKSPYPNVSLTISLLYRKQLCDYE